MQELHPNTVKLRALVASYGIDLFKLAEVLRFSYQRVKDLHSGRHHTITDNSLELLELKLQSMRKEGLL